MNTLAHSTLGAPAPPDAARLARAPLYEAVDAAPGAPPVPFRTRLRRPFARREPTVRSLIRKHRLWPALEFAYDELVREFGSVRVEALLGGEHDRFFFVALDAYAPTDDVDRVLTYEEELSRRVRERFGRPISLRMLITVHRDPDYLPLFA